MRRAWTMPAVGLALATLGGVGGLLLPAWRGAHAMRAEIDRYEAELAEPQAGPEELARLRRERDDLMLLSDQRMTPIPPEADVAGLIRELSTMLDGLGLREREITTGASKALEEASSMPMTVTLTGPFPRVAEAVLRVETLPRLVRVQRLRLSTERVRGGNTDRSGVVRADVLLEVFFDPRDVLTAEAGGGER